MTMQTETIERLRVFLIESPIKMARLQGVGNFKRVPVEPTSSSGIVPTGPGLGITVTEASLRGNARVLAER
jgi:hypothetical protein